MDNNQKLADEIINLFEELLEKNGIKIPCKDREGNENEACIYGTEYYKLEDNIIELLDKNRELNKEAECR